MKMRLTPTNRPSRSRGGVATALKGASLLVFVALAAGCTTADPPLVVEPTRAAPTVTEAPEPEPLPPVVTLVSGLQAPWSIAFHEGTALLTERDSARILAFDAEEASTLGQSELRELTTIAGVDAQGEGGLLGIAANDGYLYVYFTAESDNRVERYALTGEGDGLAIGSSESVISGIPAARNHNGGRIAFGPDGALYVTTGDAGEPYLAQSLDSLAGKILRLTPTGGIPDDNPFAGSPVFTLGHRNPQGIGWTDDGLMFASEFGQNTWDELNRIEAGQNYGWPEVEGIAGVQGFTDPLQQWNPADASPSGIAVGGEAILVANLRGERLREIPLASLDASSERFVGEFGRLRDAVIAPDGALWLLTNNTDGRGNPREGDDRVLRITL